MRHTGIDLHKRDVVVLVAERTPCEHAGLLAHMRADHAGVLGKIRDTKALDDDTAGELKTIIGEFVKTFA